MRKKKKEKKNTISIAKLLSLVLEYKKTFVFGLFALLISSLATLVFPKVLGQLVDTVRLGNESKINQTTIFLLFVFLLIALFSWIKIYCLSFVAQKTLGNLRKNLFEKLLRSPLQFFNQQKVGALSSRITSDVTLLEETYTTTFAEFIRLLITIPIGLIFLILTSFRLTIFMLMVIPIVALIGIFFGKFIKKLTKSSQSALAESTGIFSDALHGIISVKSYTNEWLEYLKYKNEIDYSIKLATKRAVWRGLFISLIIFTSGAAIISILWYGLHMVKVNMSYPNRGITLGDLISFSIYSAILGTSFSGIAELYTKLQKSIGASEFIFSLLKNEQEKVTMEKSDFQENISAKENNILFKNISFCYPSRKDIEVLKNVSFEVKTGRKIALVGESGSGKSTIINLLLRFYNPDSGKILLNQTSINDLELTHYRNLIAYVPQETILFNGTIKENICYGKTEATEDEIYQAIKIANALDFIEQFPDKLETLVGDRGIMLSGGQKQRISIARAALKQPQILVLDEATSNLDTIAEQEVKKGFQQLMEKRTTIIIAHRLSTIENVDNIFVLSNGQIVEQGTHEELINKQKVYYKLYSLQKVFS